MNRIFDKDYIDDLISKENEIIKNILDVIKDLKSVASSSYNDATRVPAEAFKGDILGSSADGKESLMCIDAVTLKDTHHVSVDASKLVLTEPHYIRCGSALFKELGHRLKVDIGTGIRLGGSPSAAVNEVSVLSVVLDDIESLVGHIEKVLEIRSLLGHKYGTDRCTQGYVHILAHQFICRFEKS